MDFLQGLNPQQQEAVRHVDGPLLILAGAGSGKTRVITHRIAHLVKAHRVPGPCILAVTFTNKAAGEMRERVARLLGGMATQESPVLSTFHSFCVRLLRRDGDHLAEFRTGFTRSFNIYDDADQIALIKQIYRHIGLDEKFMQYRAALSRISHAKNHGEGPEDLGKNKDRDPKAARLAAVFEQYEERLRQANALDFDDLLLETVRLLRKADPVREAWNRRLAYLMIDEYQDTNRVQYDLVRLLGKGHQNVAVVGDEDQSIYGWRGADIRNILDFEQDFPDAKVIRLEQNYRSTKTILDAAGAVVARNTQRKGKTLWTAAPAGDKISLYEAADGENEALWIADTIEKTLAREPETHIAVLYRTNFQSRQIEEALRRYGRKYVIVGGMSFYQRAEVKDALAYLKAIASPLDSISLLRIINTPARGIGKTTVEQIEQYALTNQLSLWHAIERMLEAQEFPPRAEAALRAFHKLLAGFLATAGETPVHVLLRNVLTDTGYFKMLEEDISPDAESRKGNLEELLNAAAEAHERGEALADFLDHAALVSDADQVDERAPISLLTMHNAKGLEFPVVFIAGMEEGLFPHSRSRDDENALEEERRLCYVAMTRAEKRLHVSWARFRRRFGGGTPEACMASRFLREIPAEVIQKVRAEAAAAQVDLFYEQHAVRESARRNTYTGRTYNSIENISQFFRERGMEPPPAAQRTAPVIPMPKYPPVAPASSTKAQAPVPKGAKGLRPGVTVLHPKYGRGTVLRREGEGEDAKLTVSFPGHGLKKLVEKFAGIRVEE